MQSKKHNDLAYELIMTMRAEFNRHVSNRKTFFSMRPYPENLLVMFKVSDEIARNAANDVDTYLKALHVVTTSIVNYSERITAHMTIVSILNNLDLNLVREKYLFYSDVVMNFISSSSEIAYLKLYKIDNTMVSLFLPSLVKIGGERYYENLIGFANQGYVEAYRLLARFPSEKTMVFCISRLVNESHLNDARIVIPFRHLLLKSYEEYMQTYNLYPLLHLEEKDVMLLENIYGMEVINTLLEREARAIALRDVILEIMKNAEYNGKLSEVILNLSRSFNVDTKLIVGSVLWRCGEEGRLLAESLVNVDDPLLSAISVHWLQKESNMIDRRTFEEIYERIVLSLVGAEYK